MKRQIVCVLTLLSLVSLLIFQSRFDVPFFQGIFAINDTESFQDASTINDTESQTVKLKIILDWTGFWGIPFTRDYPNNCPNASCMVTNNKSFLEEADAILFHSVDFSWENIPKIRHSRQRFVFFVREPPMHFAMTRMNHIPGFFNWTMTYRAEADILWSWGGLELPRTNSFIDQKMDDLRNKFPGRPWKETVGVLRNKSRPIAWFASNCHTPSQRELYVQKLKQYISVDVYGKCGWSNCSKSNQTWCERLLESDYFFYLSFENSICKDYITEKLWSRINQLVVPVVLDCSIHSNYLPNASFVAVSDFKGPKDLAEFLNRTMEDFSEYQKFFAWRKGLDVEKLQKSFLPKLGLCGLCEKLHTDSIPHSYMNLDEWWNKQSECRNHFVSKHLK